MSITPRNDAAMMANEDSWPMHILPIKRPSSVPGKFPEFGTILPGKPTVYLGGFEDVAVMSQEERDKVKKDYASYDAIVADGWLVD